MVGHSWLLERNVVGAWRPCRLDLRMAPLKVVRRCSLRPASPRIGHRTALVVLHSARIALQPRDAVAAGMMTGLPGGRGSPIEKPVLVLSVGQPRPRSPACSPGGKPPASASAVVSTASDATGHLGWLSGSAEGAGGLTRELRPAHARGVGSGVAWCVGHHGR